MIDGMTVTFVLWCVFFGLCGQGIRAIIGLYKLCIDETLDTKANFKMKRLLISLVMGACVGGLCSLIFSNPLSKTDVMGIISAGYMGVDFVEGFLEKRSGEIK